MAKAYHLSNVKTSRSRAEEHKKQYDIVTARAVSYISNILKRTHHLIKPHGYLILYKLASPEERTDLMREIKKVNLYLRDEIQYTLPSSPEIHRVLYVLQKK
jgi:16S rRNA G527 N7-methylase RsmG